MIMDNKHTARRIVIVGGGVAGLSISVRLAQSGLPVTVLEAGRLGQAASTKNQGWLYSGAWFAPQQRDLARLCYESLQQTIKFCPDCLEPGCRSMIYVVSSQKTPPAGWTRAWSEAGIPYEQVGTFAAIDETGLSESLVQHAYRLPDRAFRSDVLLERLTAKAENLGVEVRTESPVTAFIKTGDRVDGVVTLRGEEIAARIVILAANVGGVRLWPNGVQPGQQTVFHRIGLKTHCIAMRPGLADVPFCVVDADGFNHIPHRHVSVFGTSRWVPVLNADDQHVMPGEIDRLWHLISTFFPHFQRDGANIVEWSGTTVQAMHFDQIIPGLAPMPTVIDHEAERPLARNLLSVFPGRASLWPQLAEAARRVVLEKVDHAGKKPAAPPWAIASSASNPLLADSPGARR